MFDAVKAAWALFFGLGLIMLGNGLQSSLIAIRAQVEMFGNTVTGLVMAGYFVGFLIGSWLVPKLVARVGHIRMFGALASLASLAVLLHPVLINPGVWFAMRVLTGIAYAGLYIVCESWLNDRATNQTRGQLLAVYMIVSLFGMAGGQLLLNLDDPADFQLFTVVSVLISMAVVPVLVSAAPSPEFEAPETISFRRLYEVSPLGLVSMVLVGMSAGVIMGMGPAYIYQSGLSVADASFFMSAIFVGGFLLTWPLGRLSDIFDRRTVILGVAVGAATAAGLGIAVGTDHRWIMLAIAAAVGGQAMSLYSLAIAHTNDYLTPKQMVAASSSLVMVNGIGAMTGPNIAGAAMDLVGPQGFFLTLIGTHSAIAAFALWRMTRRPPLPAEEQGTFVAMEQTMTAVAATLNPAAEYPEDGAKPAADSPHGAEPATEEASENDPTPPTNR